MNYFSIKDIERMSGIKAHTLRIWEQRYGLSFCKRKESKHRYFDNEDLKEILGVAHLYHQGYKISKIATLSKDEIRHISIKPSNEDVFRTFIDKMITASLDYDDTVFARTIDEAIGKFGFEETVCGVIYPFLDKIGLLWLTGHVIPAQEHFSSSLILQKVIAAIDAFPLPLRQGNEVVLIFAPENEFHELPLLILQYRLQAMGISTCYLGANACVSTIEYLCSNKNITHIWCHLITNFLQFEPDGYIQCFLNKLPGKSFVFSGPAFGECADHGEQVRVLRSFSEFWDVKNTMGR